MTSQALYEAIAAEPYEVRGIIHSEMALIIHTCARLNVDVVIESGRARGQSMYMLAKYLPDVVVHSVELRDHPDEEFARVRLAPFSNVRLHCGDGAVELPRLIRENSGRRIAILCDGPKGHHAIDIIAQAFAYPNVRVGFIHDMRRLDHGEPSPHRAAAVARFPDGRFSDDQRLVNATSWMDANVLAAGGRCGPAHEKEFGSYGPTIGVFVNPGVQ